MTTALTYHARRLAPTAEPLAVATALAAGSCEPNVLDENRGAVGWAEGVALAVATQAGR